MSITNEEKILIANVIFAKKDLADEDREILAWCDDNSSTLEDIKPSQRNLILEALASESDLGVLISDLGKRNDTESIKMLMKKLFRTI